MKKGNRAITEILLNRNDIDAKTNNNMTPLHIAVESGHEMITSLLMDRNPNSSGYTPLHYAIDRNITQQIIIDLLFNKNANVNAKTSENSSSLHLAIYRNDEETVVKLLNNGADLDITDQKGKTPLCIAVEKGLLSLVKEILKHSPNNGDKLSLRAAICGFRDEHKKIFDILTEIGFTIDANVVEDSDLLYNSVKKGYYDVVDFLINQGADVNSVRDGVTLLHNAIENGRLEIIKLLIKSKCDMNARSKSNKIRFLLENIRFSSKKIRFSLEKCPIEYSIEKGHKNIVKLLLVNGATIEDYLLYKALNSAKICKMIIDHGVNVNACDSFSKTALHYADNQEVIELLIKKGADINARDKYGKTPLHNAISRAKNIILTLLEYDVDIDAQDGNGDTPLHLAAHDGWFYCWTMDPM